MMPGSEPNAIAGVPSPLHAASRRRLGPTALALGLLIAGMSIGPCFADAGLAEIERSLEMRLARARDALAAGQADLAVGDLSAAQGVVAQLQDPARAAAVEGLLGQALLFAGQTDAARKAFEYTLQFARDARLVGLEAAAQNDLGSLALAEHEPGTALDRFETAFDLANRAGRPDTAAAAAINASRLLAERDRATEALGWLRAARAAIDGEAAGAGKATQLLALGRQLARLGQARDAAATYQEAQGLAARFGDRRLESQAIGYRAAVYEAAGRHAEALELARSALFLAQAASAPDITYRWMWQIGRLLAAEGEVDDAIQAYEQAVRTLDQLRPDLIALSERTDQSVYGATVAPVHRELADLLLKRAAAEIDLEARQRDLRSARAVVEASRAAELEDYFRDQCIAELEARVRPIDQLATRTAAIYPIVLPERTVMLLSLPDGLAQLSLPIPADDLTVEVRELRLFLEKRTTGQYLPISQRLYDRLIRPIEPRLEDQAIDTLVFVPDGPLRTIPLAALHDGARFLIDRYAVATVPSLSLLDPRPVAEARITPLLNGLTESVQGFAPLPYVASELDAIASLYGGTVLQDDEFVVPEVEDSLAQTPYSVVHIASHGEFAGDPDESFLLTYDGRLDMDGLEQLIKLSRFRDEPVELLTLSACRTAAGDDRAALGLAGVAIKAGARSALATLWFINDQASSLLVTEFYRQLGATPTPTKAKALQLAQQALKADLRYRHPAYWSPFLIIGNWL
jgi:CHAT domain-containing protein